MGNGVWLAVSGQGFAIVSKLKDLYRIVQIFSFCAQILLMFIKSIACGKIFLYTFL